MSWLGAGGAAGMIISTSSWYQRALADAFASAAELTSHPSHPSTWRFTSRHQKLQSQSIKISGKVFRAFFLHPTLFLPGQDTGCALLCTRRYAFRSEQYGELKSGWGRGRHRREFVLLFELFVGAHIQTHPHSQPHIFKRSLGSWINKCSLHHKINWLKAAAAAAPLSTTDCDVAF